MVRYLGRNGPMCHHNLQYLSTMNLKAFAKGLRMNLSIEYPRLMDSRDDADFGTDRNVEPDAPAMGGHLQEVAPLPPVKP